MDIGPLPTPTHLDDRDLPTQKVAASFVRLHQCRYDALYFGKNGIYRFDAPHQEYGVLYMADRLEGAFVETFGDEWEIRARYNVISSRRLATRCVAKIRLTRALNICDLTEGGLAHIGADGRLTAGERLVAQQWSLAIWKHSAAVDGIRYRVRHAQSEVAVAVFDRAADALAVHPMGELTDHPLVPSLLSRYNIALV